jgi:glucose/arabinose dehydrogenase
VPEVFFAGQGGLLEVYLHPDFDNNQLVYLSFAARRAAEEKLNSLIVVRGRLDNKQLVDVATVFESYPLRKTAAHYGARIKFLQDGTMLFTSGDGFSYREKAQSLDNHFGKIIRINDDGSIPPDNPFVDKDGSLPEIWTYGHRNQQGLIIDSDGLVFSHEHGPKGGDELNLIQPGKNYGWPSITYGIDYNGSIISPFKIKDGMEQPIKFWTPSIAPSDMTFYNGNLFPDWFGSIFVSALSPGDVRRIVLKDNVFVSEEILFDEIQSRIRSIKMAPDGSLIILTDDAKDKNKSGKLIKVTPR